MVQNVNKHDSIDAGIRMRKTRSVEGRDRQPGTVPNQHIDSLNPEIWAPVEQCPRYFSVPTANVQKAASVRNQFGEKLRKTADTSTVDVGFVDLSEHAHLRPTPIILRKKLAKMISIPKVAETITAATRRTRTTGFIGPNPVRFQR